MKKLLISILVFFNIFLFVGINAEEKMTVSDFNNAETVVGVATGCMQEEIVDEELPNAKKVYYEDNANLALALSEGKIDCFVLSEVTYHILHKSYPNFENLQQKFRGSYIAYGFSYDSSKDVLFNQFNDYIIRNKENINRIIDKWTDHQDEVIRPDYHSLEAPNGVLEIVSAATIEPFIYFENNDITGIEIEILTDFAKEYGYGLNLTNSALDSIILSIKQNKADIAAAALLVTDERKESLRFSEPYFYVDNLLIYQPSTLHKSNNVNSIKDLFEKSFIREDRWKLLLDGLYVTILITISSAILATLFASLICYLKIKGNKTVVRICDAYIRIFEGTPILVLLLVFYYIIFSDRGTSATLVAILVCSLNSAAFFAESFYAGITSIDNGQREAGLSLGYSEVKTFFRFILPQAAIVFMPTYQSSLIALLKGTSVVSYISVQDLTKAGELIRTRTYEPLLPLLTIAVVYYLLSRFITIIFSKIQKSLKPAKYGHYLKKTIISQERNKKY